MPTVTKPADVPAVARLQRRAISYVAGQFLVAILVNVLLANDAADALGDVLILAGLAAILALSFAFAATIARLTLALGWTPLSSRLSVVVGMLPYVNTIVLLYVNAKANAVLGQAGIRVGLFGAKLADVQAWTAAECPECGSDLREACADRCPNCGAPRSLQSPGDRAAVSVAGVADRQRFLSACLAMQVGLIVLHMLVVEVLNPSDNVREVLGILRLSLSMLLWGCIWAGVQYTLRAMRQDLVWHLSLGLVALVPYLNLLAGLITVVLAGRAIRKQRLPGEKDWPQSLGGPVPVEPRR